VGDREDRDARPPVGGVEQLPDVERVALEPRREARRGERVVQLRGEREAVLRRKEGFEIQETPVEVSTALERMINRVLPISRVATRQPFLKLSP